MEINVRDESKIVEIWLSNVEKNDAALRERLKPLYAEYMQKKYTIAVFVSGDRDIYQSTLGLLAYNKKRVAELETQREKKRASGLER